MEACSKFYFATATVTVVVVVVIVVQQQQQQLGFLYFWPGLHNNMNLCFAISKFL